MAYDRNNVFARILRGELPCTKVYEDEHVLAFHDVRPQAPVHFLLIPKAHVPSLYEADMSQRDAWARMLALVGGLARTAGAGEGFRTIINTGRVGHQEVYHVHMHVLGGPHPLGPMLQRSYQHGK